MNHTFDALVVGAGFAGAVTARELAERGNLRVPCNTFPLRK